MKREQQLPRLIIGGTAKAGTSAIFNYLAMHPEVYGSSKKETHYFSSLLHGKPLAPIEDYQRFLRRVVMKHIT